MSTKDLIQKEANKYLRYRDCLERIPLCEVINFRKEVEEAYNRICGQVVVCFVGHDPYKDLEEMTYDIKINNHLEVSNLHNDSNLLPGELNLKFRAVHDYLHYLLQQPFDFKGELNVYKAQKFLHESDIGKRILYSEIVLQAAYATYFKGFPDKQKVII